MTKIKRVCSNCNLPLRIADAYFPIGCSRGAMCKECFWKWCYGQLGEEKKEVRGENQN